MAQLCKIYSRPGSDRQGKSPVILLESRSFPNKNGGTTTWAVFKLIGWEFFAPGVPAPPVTLIAVPVVPPAPAANAQPRHGDMDDEVPF